MSNLEEQRETFNKQMNAWSSSQGVWHQIRHAGVGQNVFLKIINLLSICAVIALIAAVVMGAYLFVRVGTDGFKRDVEKRLARVLSAEKAEITSIKKDGTSASIGRLNLIGSEGSYFYNARANHIDFKMRALNGLGGKWDLGVIKFRKLEMALKSGEGDDQKSRKTYQSLFANYGELDFKRVEIQDVTLYWGQTEVDKGFIKGSTLTAFRKGSSWELEFTGGTLTQNWLHDISIDKISVLCNEEGITVSEASLSNGEGTLSFKLGVDVSSQPKVSGSFEMNSLPVDALLPKDYKNLMRGAVSGSGNLSGSLNSVKGVIFDADLVFGEEGDQLTLFDTVPLLETLSVIDINRSYHKVVFDKASLNLQVAGKTVSYQDIKLYSDSQLGIMGDFVIRPPLYSEVAKALNIAESDVKKSIEGYSSILDDSEAGESIISAEFDGADELTAFTEMRKGSIEREFAYNRFVGSLDVTLNSDAFDKSAALREAYPVNTSSGKIHVATPLDGVFSSLTKELSEEIFALGKTRN